MAAAACVLLGGDVARAQAPCAPGPVPPPASFTAGEYDFRGDNTPTVLLGTNPFAPTAAEFSPLFVGAGANEKLVRLFVHSLKQFPTYAGEVDQAWATEWDTVLCDAQANGLYALVALDVWPNWNDNAPRGARNRINVSRPRPVALPVAILATSIAMGEPLDFNARWVNPSTVRFGPAGAVVERSSLADVDGDGDEDLVLPFRKLATGLACGDTVATLTGETLTGRSIVGSDSVRIVGCGPIDGHCDRLGFTACRGGDEKPSAWSTC